MRDYPYKSGAAICVEGLKDACTGAYINDATVTAKLQDATETDIPGSSVTLTYSGNNDGVYTGVIPSTVDLSSLSFVYLVIIASKGGTTHLYIQEPLRVKVAQRA